MVEFCIKCFHKIVFVKIKRTRLIYCCFARRAARLTSFQSSQCDQDSCTTVAGYLGILHGPARGTGSSQVKARRGMARPGSRCVQRSSFFRGRDVPTGLAIAIVVTRSILASIFCRRTHTMSKCINWDRDKERKDAIYYTNRDYISMQLESRIDEYRMKCINMIVFYVIKKII